jgi:hypothetical protein
MVICGVTLKKKKSTMHMSLFVVTFNCKEAINLLRLVSLKVLYFMVSFFLSLPLEFHSRSNTCKLLCAVGTTSIAFTLTRSFWLSMNAAASATSSATNGSKPDMNSSY